MRSIEAPKLAFTYLLQHVSEGPVSKLAVRAVERKIATALANGEPCSGPNIWTDSIPLGQEVLSHNAALGTIFVESELSAPGSMNDF